MNNPMARKFEFLAFHRTIEQSRALADAAIDGLILDFERRGKHARQAGFDTEISRHELTDIPVVRNETGAYLLCRVNGPGDETLREIDAVLASGVDEIIIPMITRFEDAAALVRHIGQDAHVTLMVETREASELARDFNQLPVKRIYVGLNDLHISRGTSSVFAPFADGMLDLIRSAVDQPQFGVAGLTLPGFGKPIPVELIFGELARIRADFTFLRRSFYRDVGTLDLSAALASLRQTMTLTQERPGDDVARDREELIRMVSQAQTFARV